MSDASPRQVYDAFTSLLPEVTMLGTDAPRSATDRSLQRHIHPDTYEICYIARGHVEWWVEGEQVYEIGPGEVFITRPDELHGGLDAVLHPCKLYWLQLRLGRGRATSRLSRCETDLLAAGLARLTRRQFPAPDVVAEAFGRLLAEFQQPDDYAVLAARGALADLLTAVLRSHDRQPRDASPREVDDPPVRQAMRWLERHFTEDFQIEELAQHVGLSVGHFHERFRRAVGYTPAQWRLRRRVQLAKQLLRADLSIMQVAMQAGFSSSQYFATTFKRLVGLTPRTYRRRLAQREPAPAKVTRHRGRARARPIG